MNSRILLAIAGAVAFSFPTAPVAAQVPTVTLDEALELARRYSPAIIQAEGNVRVAQATKRESISDWLPRISGGTGWSINSTERFDPNNQITVSGSSTSMSGSLSASYTVFDGFRREANAQARGADLNSAEASYVAQEFSIALQTKQAFFNAIAADELVRVSETRIARAVRQLQTTRDRLAAGSAIRSDTLQAFVEWANARLQLINAQTQRSTASANLARLIGHDGEVRATSDESMQLIIDIDTALIRAEALEQGPDIEQVVASARAADAQVRVARAAYFPSISASYSRSLAGQELSNLRSSWSGRVSLSWQIFNGFARETGVQRSRAAQDAADAQIEDTRRQVNAQLTQQFAALQSAAISVQIAQASLAAANEDLRVQQERYRLGAATILEVMQSQINVDQAEVDGVQARLDYFLAKAQIEALVGRTI